MSTSASVVISSCEYWMRIAISLHLCVKKALLDILHDPNIHGLSSDEHQLFQELDQFKQNQQHALRNVIKPFQWDKMCHFCSASCPNPCPRQGKTKAEDLDITCIVVLLTNLTTMQPPQGGWRNPNPNDTSKAAYVLHARQLRNDINHCAVQEISSLQKFNTYWHRVKSILLGLQFSDMKLFNDLKTNSLDANTDLRITGLTDQMNLKITILVDQMSDLGDDMKTQSQKTAKDVNQLHTIINGIKQQLTSLKNFPVTGLDKFNRDSQLEALEENVRFFECNLESLNKRLTNVESKIKEHKQMFNQQHQINILREQKSNQHEQEIDQHHQKIVQHDQQFSKQDQKNNQLEQEISQHHQQIGQYDQQFIQHGQQISHHEQQISQHNQQFSQQERQITQDHQQISQHNQQISQHDQRISSVEKNFNHMQLTTSKFENDLEKSSEELRDWTKQKYENVFVTFEKSGLHPPKANKREDIVVGLSLIKDAEKAFFQAADGYINEEEISKHLEGGVYRSETPNIILKMRYELEEVSSRQTDYNDIMKSPNDYVVISGAPGCGKTTLCETLAYNWACKKIWVEKPNFQFVFILKFRELHRFKNDQNVTAKGILSHYYPEHFNEKTTTMLKNNSLLILDGFDECFNKYDLLESESEFTNYTRALYDLLDSHNTKLPSARLITSRPASCSILFKLLKSEQRQQRLFEVTGFSLENVKKYVMHYYQQTSHSSDVQQEKLSKFLEEVEHSPILRSLMTIPFYCNGVCCLMLESEIGIESIPLTYTGLFTTLLTLFLRNHGLRNSKLSLTDVLNKETTQSMILMLSKFAFSMERKKKITFTKTDFPKELRNLTNFEELVERTGLILKLDNEDEPFYQFVHYSFHEFLVALHLFNIGSTHYSTNPYIISMVGGLTGGLMGVSKSTYLFVKKYALMFQPRKPMPIEVLLKRHNEISQFLAIIFEYQNKLHLKHTIVRMSSTRGNTYPKKHHMQYLVKSSSEKHIVIDSVLIKTDLTCLHTHEELLVAFTQSALFKVLFVNGSYHPEENQGIVGLSYKTSHFDKLISLEDTLIIAKYLDIASFTNDLEFIEYFDYDSVKDAIFNLPVGNVNLTIHVNVLDFVKTKASLRTKFEHYCKLFKSVTISLYTNKEQRDRYHSHGSSCFPAKFIGEVKRAIVRNRYQLNNLKFAASCTFGVEDGVVPSIRKI